MRGRLGFPACDLVKVRIDHVSYWFVCDLTFELVDLDLGVIFPHAGCKLSDQHHNNRVAQQAFQALVPLGRFYGWS
jgi:hypothetical protein